MIAVVQLDTSRDRPIVETRPVLAPQILESDAVTSHDDARMTTGDAGAVQVNRNRGIAADHVVAIGERDAPAAHDEPAADTRWQVGCVDVDSAGERIADAVRGPDQRRRRIAIVERPTQLFDETDERRLCHERVGPEPLVQLLLVNDARRFGDEHREQIEGLRREMDVRIAATQLSPF